MPSRSTKGPLLPSGWSLCSWTKLVSFSEPCVTIKLTKTRTDFHCAIAISTTALNAHVVQPDLTGAIYHLSHAFRFMNEKLSGDDALSDTTIAVAVMLAKYEPLCGHHSQGLVHLQAVHRMVHLRGGIAHFTKNRPNISQKIFRYAIYDSYGWRVLMTSRRSDLDYSLHMGTPTRFTVDDVLKDTVAVVGVPGHIYSQYDWYSDQTPKVLAEGHLSTDLRDLFINNIHLAHMLNDGDAKRGPKLNTYAFHETTILIGYRLVSFSTLGGSRPTDSLENIVHLGLMAFIVSFLRGLDRRITDVPLLSELSRHAAQKAYDGEREDLEVLLWTLFIGTPSVYAPQDEEWLVPKTVDTMRALSLRSWDDVLGILTKFPWVHVVHDQGGRALWHKAAARANTRTGIGFTL